MTRSGLAIGLFGSVVCWGLAIGTLYLFGAHYDVMVPLTVGGGMAAIATLLWRDAKNDETAAPRWATRTLAVGVYVLAAMIIAGGVS